MSSIAGGGATSRRKSSGGGRAGGTREAERPATLSIEIVHPEIERGRITSALFDFDGTLSLIREGWQQVMIPMMVEVLLGTPRHEKEDEIEAVVTEFVTNLTGRQTIYQMFRLAEEVAKREGRPLHALEYKGMYLRRLWGRIGNRLAALEEGRVHPDDHLVPGSREMLEELDRRGVELCLASGTDREDVLREARALGLDQFFGDRIYGALERYWEFSKEALLQRIVEEGNLSGPQLVVFGDGFVEIESAKAIGGIAVGVASEEARRSGVNEWKRRRLIEAGADVIIPDYRQHAQIVAYLWGEVDVV